VSEAQKTKDMTPEQEERAVREWDVLFKSPAEAQKFESMAKQLIASGLGKRKIKMKNGKYRIETDLEYMLRVQYCVVMEIPKCLINKTYIMEGTVSQMVEAKGVNFYRQFPQAEIVTIMSTPDKCMKKGRCHPSHNWVPVTWTLEKAKKLKIYHESKAQWTENSQGMLANRCDGQEMDILSGHKMGSGYLSVEEIDSLGIDVEEKDDEH